MGELLATGGTQGEKDLLAQFATAFAEFQRIDKDLLALAVKNTNLKAYNLAFGPAATRLKEMDTALARLATTMPSHAPRRQRAHRRVAVADIDSAAHRGRGRKEGRRDGSVDGDGRRAGPQKSGKPLAALPKFRQRSRNSPPPRAATPSSASSNTTHRTLPREHQRPLAVHFAESKTQVMLVCQDTLAPCNKRSWRNQSPASRTEFPSVRADFSK